MIEGNYWELYLTTAKEIRELRVKLAEIKVIAEEPTETGDAAYNQLDRIATLTGEIAMTADQTAARKAAEEIIKRFTRGKGLFIQPDAEDVESIIARHLPQPAGDAREAFENECKNRCLSIKRNNRDYIDRTYADKSTELAWLVWQAAFAAGAAWAAKGVT